MMEAAVQALFSDEIIHFGLNQFSVDIASLKKLGEFESYIFEGMKDNQAVILRYTHSSHRNRQQILSEIDWVSYLKSNRVNVYEHYRSINDRYLESVLALDGSEFYVCCYEKLPGVRVEVNMIMENSDLIVKWGEVIGEMHSITTTYKPSIHVGKRLEWYEEELLDLHQYKVKDQTIRYGQSIVKSLCKLKKNSENYGLIHSDLHSGNFTYDQGDLYIFDFDDCSYHWFASDIAIPLYYTVLSRSFQFKDGEQDFAYYFMKYFLEGYRKNHFITQDDLKTIPLFLKLRDITLLSVMLKKFDLDNLSDSEARLYQSVKHRVDNEVSIVNVNWSEI
ncbi:MULTISPECIES: phosphotransferase enzyme family protein [Bacillus]|uniref:phosphotransferase enzyme family protein n=1 Tax=Bacillus TaxID=1386 RepID=UPI000362245C|nr:MULTISPECIES: phosphotransferase [Bacillus]